MIEVIHAMMLAAAASFLLLALLARNRPSPLSGNPEPAPGRGADGRT
jgi:hypothetical protein